MSRFASSRMLRRRAMRSGPVSGRCFRRQRGVGLIEVMIAVLILSIGFLGVGALLAMSLSTNNSAMARSMATIHSYSILDAMRADLNNAEAGNYNTTVYADACPASTASVLSSVQLSAWCTQLGNDLGKQHSTNGAVQCSSTGDCTVTISFDDSRSGLQGSATQTVVTKGML